jgi:glucose-1-phosphate cytidylyltransferase
MQTVILCGGTGTRLKEQTEFLPKPLIQIGGKPMIWHIMKIYAHYGYTDFVLALGYRQECFKDYFAHFYEINHDMILTELGISWKPIIEKWRVVLSDTGLNTLKGARLKRVERYIKGNTFMCSYGDGLSDVNLYDLLSFHKSHGKIATITGVHPSPRFGEIHHVGGLVQEFTEKPQGECLMNGGFMVFNRGVFDYLSEDENCDLETDCFHDLTQDKELMVYHHKGFWKCCDNLYDMGVLQNMWGAGNPKWRVWE